MHVNFQRRTRGEKVGDHVGTPWPRAGAWAAPTWPSRNRLLMPPRRLYIPLELKTYGMEPISPFRYRAVVVTVTSLEPCSGTLLAGGNVAGGIYNTIPDSMMMRE